MVVVPCPLADTFDMFQETLQEVVAEELVQRARRRVRDVVELEFASHDAVETLRKGSNTIPILVYAR